MFPRIPRNSHLIQRIIIMCICVHTQEPVGVELGIKYVWKGSGLMRRMVQKDTFSNVPILAVLGRMLQNSIFQDVNFFV